MQRLLHGFQMPATSAPPPTATGGAPPNAQHQQPQQSQSRPQAAAPSAGATQGTAGAAKGSQLSTLLALLSKTAQAGGVKPTKVGASAPGPSLAGGGYNGDNPRDGEHKPHY